MVDSTSTLAQVQAAYDDNANYAEVASVAKARAFVTACRILLRRVPGRMSTAGDSLDLNASLIRAEMADAKNFIAANRAGSVRHVDFRGFRS